MLDPQLLRSDIETVAKRLRETRDFHLEAELYRKYEEQRKSVQIQTQALQASRNVTSTQVFIAKEKREELKRVPTRKLLASIKRDLRKQMHASRSSAKQKKT